MAARPRPKTLGGGARARQSAEQQRMSFDCGASSFRVALVLWQITGCVLNLHVLSPAHVPSLASFRAASVNEGFVCIHDISSELS